jgi:hypothetical protein
MDKLVRKLNSRYSTRYDVDDIKPYINDINWDEYKSDDIQEVLSYLYDRIRGKPIENTLAINSVFGVSSYDEIKNNIVSETVYSYLIFDSKYQDKSNQYADGVFFFNYQLIGSAGGIGIISSTNEIKNIKAMTMYKPTIPSTKYIDFNHRQMNISIKEINKQSYYCTSENQRAHWIIKVADIYIDGYNVLDFDDEEFNGINNRFIFNFPVPFISTFTLVIGNCNQNIAFDHDSDTATISSYGNPLKFTTSKPHGFIRSFYVSITGFNTADPYTDKWIIDTVNSERAQLATNTGLNEFALSIDASSLTPLIGLTVNVYLEDRRIIIPIIIEHE